MAAVQLDTKAFLRSIGSEQFYKDAIEQAGNFNMRMSIERKQRLPFIDSHTGVAQNHSDLFHPYRYRNTGNSFGQLYSFPMKRWKKKKKSFFAYDISFAKGGDIETGEADMHQINAVENPAHREDFYDEKLEGQDQWYDDLEGIGEPPDAGEMVDDQSDISDYEDQLKGRKRRKKESVKSSRGRKKIEKDPNAEDKEKPYVCEVCGARYKTRPGLAYHYTHFHNGLMDEEACAPSPKPPARAGRSTKEREQGNGKPAPSTSTTTSAVVSTAVEPKISANSYCDFCLGDSYENKKTHQAEELVSCSDCGRSGHPSCLQFTDNMIISVKKYPWQCIECKSCGLCGTSDNDDQLLFCDDCDRGYHMYCLKPPLTEPPEGNWSCHLCIEEFHGGKKPEGMQ
ncbi:zinc finger protein ubi-d4 A-like [Babylonia areolata]|uniref:zinc finger protein ubi-d4 A-like n=1 Tax=Babylonia areolata TaxID=304850 RepID=UPI003FD348E1